MPSPGSRVGNLPPSLSIILYRSLKSFLFNLYFRMCLSLLTPVQWFGILQKEVSKYVAGPIRSMLDARKLDAQDHSRCLPVEQ